MIGDSWERWSLLDGGKVRAKARWCLEDGAKFGAAEARNSRRGLAEDTAIETHNLTEPDHKHLVLPGQGHWAWWFWGQMKDSKHRSDKPKFVVRWVMEAVGWQQEDPMGQGTQCQKTNKAKKKLSPKNWACTGRPVVFFFFFLFWLVLPFVFLQIFTEYLQCCRHSGIYT